jgi:ABC-2 type transport system permease protein
MNKIWLITQREFLTRIRKRSFIIMSIMGPVLIAGFFAAMFYMATTQDTDFKKIAVIDSTGIFLKRIPDTKYLHFEYVNTKVESLKKILKKSDYFGILYISPIIAYSPRAVQFYSYQQPSMAILQHISNAIEKEVRNQKLLAYKINNIDAILKSVETNIDIETVKLTESGEEKKSSTGVAMAVAYVGSLLIYMFILLFGVQVMRGVIEEKTNRIVEVIISSVKPFQLMMGKVLGVALTAITQFTIWIVLSVILVSLIKSAFMPDLSPVSVASQPHNLMEVSKTIPKAAPQAPTINPELANAFSTIDSINFYVMIGSFFFYFIAGYLLYSSLFAAVGAAVDNEADTQQFVFPITLPLIIGIMVMIGAFQNPGSSIAFWFSMIPFTSPIVMMARIPFGVPYEQVVISMVLLVATFIATIWLAGKIYRTGILMYGNKASFKEMIKWLKYKN